MTTCRDIVTRALRMAGIVRRGRDPTAAEMSDGLFALQGLYDTWFTGGMFGMLSDHYAEGDYEAEVGQRIYITSGAVTLPTLVDDDHKPRDLAAVEVNTSTGREAYLWDRNAWVRIDALAENDDVPLASRGAEGLAACLALWIAEEYGASVTASMMSKAGSFKTNLRLRYGTEQEPVAGTWF